MRLSDVSTRLIRALKALHLVRTPARQAHIPLRLLGVLRSKLSIRAEKARVLRTFYIWPRDGRATEAHEHDTHGAYGLHTILVTTALRHLLKVENCGLGAHRRRAPLTSRVWCAAIRARACSRPAKAVLTEQANHGKPVVIAGQAGRGSRGLVPSTAGGL